MLLNRKAGLSVVLIIFILCILTTYCNVKIKSQVIEEKYPIILGFKLGDNYYSIKNHIDSLKAAGKIISTSNRNFNFNLPLITDSIKCHSGVDGNDFYKNKFYSFDVYSNIEGSWKNVVNHHNELKELFSYKYVQTSSDSSQTYSWHGKDESKIFNRWQKGDLEVFMEHYIVDITKVPENLDWNTNAYYGVSNLSTQDIFNKTSESLGRYVIVLHFQYRVISVYKDWATNYSYTLDSIKNINIRKREQQKDSLIQNF